MTAKTAQVLRDAKALIANPDQWIKGVSVIKIEGRTCMCSVGAITQVPAIHPALRLRAIEAMEDVLGSILVTFNDHPDTTHGDVMAAFDRAIAAEESA